MRRHGTKQYNLNLIKNTNDSAFLLVHQRSVPSFVYIVHVSLQLR